MQLISIRPLAISALARAALAHGTARILAAHNRGISLAATGCDDVLFMSAPGSGLLPLHLVVRARDLGRAIGVLDSGGGPAPAPQLCIDAAGVRLFHTRLPQDAAGMASRRARDNIAAAARWLRAHPLPLGLGATAAELLARGGRWRGALAQAGHRADAADPGLRALIGRGAGTTPAGDDLVLGALAYAWSTQGEQAAIVAAMRALEGELAALTTAAGASYLRAATRGEFGSHLIAWVRTLPHAGAGRSLALAQRIAAQGATSGYDTLSGFVAAAEAGAGLH